METFSFSSNIIAALNSLPLELLLELTTLEICGIEMEDVG
jgi:hypothetical protein